MERDELVPDNVSEKDLKDEANRRSARAGYTTRSGGPVNSAKIMITVPYGKEKLNVWPRDPVTGELIDD